MLPSQWAGEGGSEELQDLRPRGVGLLCHARDAEEGVPPPGVFGEPRQCARRSEPFGVFSDAVSDPALREVLSTRLQDPYRLALQEALGEPENRVLFFIDVVVGTLLHRMGMTGEPMVDADVAALVEMVLPHFADGPGPT